MTRIDRSDIEDIEIAGESPEDAALAILVELRDVGFGRHTVDTLSGHFDEIFESEAHAEDVLERLRARGLVAKSHARDEFYYRPTEQGLKTHQNADDSRVA